MIELQNRIDLYQSITRDQDLLQSLEHLAEHIVSTHKIGGSILCAGNGGSQAQASHLSAELVVRYAADSKRPHIKSLSLSADASVLTASANDFDFENVFSTQLKAFASSEDLLILFSTSGRSKNIINAISYGVGKMSAANIYLICGRNTPSSLLDLGINTIAPPTRPQQMSTALIQEFHLFIVHAVCELLESRAY